MKKRIILLFALIQVTIFLHSQVRIVKGVVLHGQTPIANASVKALAKDSSGLVKYFSITDTMGVFILKIPSTEKEVLCLQISNVGYVTYNKLLFFPYSINFINIELQQQHKELPSINIKSLLPIVQKGDTTTYKVQAFEKGNEQNIGDLLKRLPGLQIDQNGRASFNGKPISRILIEGDDLFNSNYETLINNTGTSGLDQIDLIENYADTTQLKNKNSKGTETVINLKYKQKKVKIFGNSSFGLGIPIETHEIKLSLVSILKKNKFVITANKNTVGVLANSLNGNESDFKMITNKNFSSYTRIINPAPPVRLSDVVPINVNSSRVFDNNSLYLTFNQKNTLSQRVTIRTIANLISDNYNQIQNTTRISNNTEQPLTIKQYNKMGKENHLFYFLNEFTFLHSKRWQTTLSIDINNLQLKQQQAGIFQILPLTQKIAQSTNQLNITATSTILILPNKKISFTGLLNSFKLSNIYNITPPFFDSLFKPDGLFNNLEQNFRNKANTAILEINYSYSRTNTNYNIQFTFSHEKNKIKNNVEIYNDADNKQDFFTDIFNRPNIFRKKQYGLLFSINKTVNTKIQSTLSLELQLAQLNNHQLKPKSIISIERFLVLPSFNFKYKISKKSSFFLASQFTPIFPSANTMHTGLFFSAPTSINIGTNQFNINKGYTINSSLMHFDPTKKGLIASTYIFHTNNPTNYYSSTNNRGLFTFSNLLLNNEKNSFFTLGIRGEKSLQKIKSSLILNIVNSTARLPNVLGGLNVISKIHTINSEFRYKTNWKSWFNVNTGILLQQQQQNTFFEKSKLSNFKTIDFIYNTGITFTLNETFIIDLQLDYLKNTQTTQNTNTLLFADFQARFMLSKSLNLGILLRNINNVKEYSTASINPFEKSINVIQLRPFFGLINLGLKF